MNGERVTIECDACANSAMNQQHTAQCPGELALFVAVGRWSLHRPFVDDIGIANSMARNAALSLVANEAVTALSVPDLLDVIRSELDTYDRKLRAESINANLGRTLTITPQ